MTHRNTPTDADAELERDLRASFTHAEHHHRLSAAIASLTPGNQEVVQLRYRHCHTYEQIGARMGIGAKSVGGRIRHIRRTLAIALGTQPDAPAKPNKHRAKEAAGALGAAPPVRSYHATMTPHEAWMLWFMRREARLGCSGELVVRGRN
jgi:DNA-binding CsgD family transcriptional regulator